VVNEASAPVPVRVASGDQPGGGPASQGLLASIGAGLGNLIGGTAGGFFGAFAAPWIGVANLAIAVTGMITLAEQVRAFVRELTASLRGLITLLFSELTAAGIFPVSRLIASLLVLIDRGIALVLAHVQPIVIWAERLVERVVAWLGQVIDRAVRWLGAVVNEAARFTGVYLDHLIHTVIRPAVDAMIRDAIRAVVSSLSQLLFGWLSAFGNLLTAIWDYALAKLNRWLVQLGNTFSLTPAPVPPDPRFPDLYAAMREGAALGSRFGLGMTESILGPPPARGAAGDAGAGARPGTRRSLRGPLRFRMPSLRLPELTLPDMPAPELQLERLMQAPPAAAETPVQRPVTLNGVSVQIHSETVSMDNAEETARAIAAHLADEIARLTQADRFGRGLPTSAIA
jgi:hypothetical protein